MLHNGLGFWHSKVLPFHLISRQRFRNRKSQNYIVLIKKVKVMYAIYIFLTIVLKKSTRTVPTPVYVAKMSCVKLEIMDGQMFACKAV